MTDSAHEALGDCCPCGASLEQGMKRCRKCRARSRYRRRRAHRRRPASARNRRAGVGPPRRRDR